MNDFSDRQLEPGWNVVGIANPGYALEQFADADIYQ